MIDPVVCVDGFTYERANLNEWFRTQSTTVGGRVPVFTSPQTGQTLASTVIIPNTNLKRAIEFFVDRVQSDTSPVVAATSMCKTNTTHQQPLSLFQFSPHAMGKCVILGDSREQVIRTRIHTDTAAWYEYIAFSSVPARITTNETPRVQFRVGKCRTGWGGLTVGFSPLAPDLIKVPDLTDFVDAKCWWLDSNRWFHTPETGTTLVPWSTDELRPGDVVSLAVPEPGRICVYMNNVKKLDLKDTGVPLKLGSQLYGFVALTGGYEEVTIVGGHFPLETVP